MEEDYFSESPEMYPIDWKSKEYDFGFSYERNCYSGALLAVYDNNLDSLKELVQKGHSVNNNDNFGNTPLHLAVIHERKEMVQYLCSRDDIRVNTRNFAGATPLFMAVKKFNFELVKLLLQHEACPNLPINEDMTPLHLAASCPEMAKILIENGAKINVQDYSGETPLHEAVQESCIEVVCMLLYYNADANVACNKGITPFMKALTMKSQELQEILFEYVNDFNVFTTFNVSVLALALINSCPVNMVEEIIKRGADVSCVALDEDQPMDALHLCFRICNFQYFKVVFDCLTGDCPPEQNILSKLVLSRIENEHFVRFVKIIMESGNVKYLKSLQNSNLHGLVGYFFQHNLDVELLTSFILHLMSYGIKITTKEVHKVFWCYGYCNLFKILLHMDFTGYYTQALVPNLLYDVTKTTTKIFKQFIDHTKYAGSIDLSPNDLMTSLQYSFKPQLIEILRQRQDTSKALLDKLEQLPQVPLLKDLSRNVARDFIIQKLQMKTCSQYLTWIKYSEMCPVYKQLLSFEKQIY